MRHLRRFHRRLALRRRDLLGLLVGGLLLRPGGAAARIGAVFHGGSGGFKPVTTTTVYNASASALTNSPYFWGQAFQQGAIPAGWVPVITDMAGIKWQMQMDQVGKPWPDGSLRHCVIGTVIPTTIPHANNLQFKIQKTTGTYSAATPRAIGDISIGHQFQVRFADVVNSSKTPVNGPSGSNDWMFDVNTAIGAGNYEIFANGPVYLGAHVFGFLTDAGLSGTATGGAASNWLWCDSYFWVYSDPANPANVLSTEHIHRISQPYIDVALPDAAIGHVTMYDGTFLERDLSPPPISFTNAAVTVAAGGPITVPNNGAVAGEVYQFNVVSGMAPGPLTDCQYVWISQNNNTLNAQTQMFLGADPGYPSTGANPVTITSAGSGSFTLTRKTAVYYYQGAWVTADDLGNTFWTGPSPIVMNLDGTTNDHSTASEKAYWQSTGLIPPWDLSGGSAIDTINGFGPNTGSFASQLYRPGTVGMARFGIGQAGGGLNVGPFTEWEARGFARMGATNWTPADWDIIRANALTTSHYPYAIMKQSATRRIPPVNNGPVLIDGSGPASTGSYPSLGIAKPTMAVVTASVTTGGINIPAGGAVWAGGPFTPQTSNDHWPRQAILAYMLTGRRHFLDMLRENASHVLVCNPDGTGFPNNEINRNKQLGAKNFYGCVLIGQQPRSAMCIIDIAAASILGNAADAEIAYFEDCDLSNSGMYDYWLNTWKNPSIKAAGVNDPSRIYNDASFMTGYCGIADAYRHNIKRRVQLLVPCGNDATQISIAWDGVVSPVYWATTENRASTGNINPSGATGTVPAASEWGPLPGGTATIDSTGQWSDPLAIDAFLTNGDRLYPLGSAGAPLGTYDGPTQLSPTTKYYLINVVNGPPNTFKLSLTSGGAAVAWSPSTSYTGQNYTLFPQYNPGSGLYNGDESLPDEYGLISRAALNMLTQTGASSVTGTLATARSNATTRFTGNYNPQSSSMGFKYSMTNVVTIA